MNSEELEQSLRAEFESYLKEVFGEIRQEMDGFREKLDVEFRQHKERVDEALRDLESKALVNPELQASFRETVTEHLRLAKDEGARITATAIAEAEELHGSGPGEDRGAAFGDLRDAISDIASKSSQADILSALVEHAAEYTPRGAFFIVKNEHLVGWKVFGLEEHDEPDAVRELYFPLSARTALSEAIESLATVESVGEGFSDSEVYLSRLGFEHARKMIAVPLVARGRGVAVLYADCGVNGGVVNSEALETLVRVAGLTVELLASAPHIAAPVREPAHEEEHSAEGPVESRETEEVPEYQAAEETWSPVPAEETEESYETVSDAGYWSAEEEEEPEPVSDLGGYEEEQPESHSSEEAESAREEFGTSEPVEGDRGFSFRPAEPEPESYEGEAEESDSGFEYAEPKPVEDLSGGVEPEFAETFEPVDAEISAEEQFEAEVEKLYEYEEPEDEPVSAEPESDAEYAVSPGDFSFAPSEPEAATDSETASEVSYGYGSLSEEAARAEAEFEAAQESDVSSEAEPTPEPAGTPVETVAAAETGAPVRRRFGDRNIDLPIEVSEDERQYHNSARRFARLLVEEIRLYNEQKVAEGCEANDLYDRLKEAIDRSREMYEKRVHGLVAERFDYFNYELVNNLAHGDESKLGDNYPGSAV